MLYVRMRIESSRMLSPRQIEMLKDILAQGGCARLGKQSNKLTVLNSAADHIRDLQVRVL